MVGLGLEKDMTQTTQSLGVQPSLEGSQLTTNMAQ